MSGSKWQGLCLTEHPTFHKQKITWHKVECYEPSKHDVVPFPWARMDRSRQNVTACRGRHVGWKATTRKGCVRCQTSVRIRWCSVENRSVLGRYGVEPRSLQRSSYRHNGAAKKGKKKTRSNGPLHCSGLREHHEPQWLRRTLMMQLHNMMWTTSLYVVMLQKWCASERSPTCSVVH